VLAGFSDGALMALDAATGKVLWESDLSADVRGATDVDTTAVVADGVVYSSAFGEGPAALRLSDGERLWRAREFGPSRPLVMGDLLITGTADGTVVALRRADGTMKWRTRLATTAAWSPVAVGDAIVVGGDRGLWLLRTADGAPMVRLSLTHGARGTPEVAGRRIFFVGGGGTVNAVDVLAP
jgi:outer membrane protein assembly factor BamB